MTPGEFTSWLEGFLDGKDRLSKEQLKAIKKKASEVRAETIYYRPYYPYYPWTYTTTGGSIGASDNITYTSVNNPSITNVDNTISTSASSAVSWR